ncbi:hypothetical protein [Celerinatantimonas diazotrophica]|uniref:ABC-type proline/glycine betaine transport system permease subunit n=1 Tax=Celerinatantimonas diazotrophica TaxID=412034 RepID=A0A4R1J8M6_9GAMM|nr:hypothetical protein [Celerinatantimonas diazotrophica]TCK46945.1 ABC-type proline/glycine betaine transport system permease subunit [Celerinatantimonas diazotrophica]CAG9295713.1 hypothetical protein CEDIAZO_00839 [Celerinatantimonas diazotrophica]
MVPWSLWEKLTTAPWLSINAAGQFVQWFNHLLMLIPFGAVIAVALGISLIRRRWWSAVAAVVIPMVAYSLNIWELFIEQLGWWLLIWLISFALCRTATHYLMLSTTCLKIANRCQFFWPLYVGLCSIVIFHPSWLVGVASALIALIPTFICQRLRLFAQLPSKPLEQAQMLGANKAQRMQWVAKRWLTPRLQNWRARTLQQSLLYCAFAGMIGLPGLGQHFYQGLSQGQHAMVGQTILTLLLLQLLLWSIDHAHKEVL